MKFKRNFHISLNNFLKKNNRNSTKTRTHKIFSKSEHISHTKELFVDQSVQRNDALKDSYLKYSPRTIQFHHCVPCRTTKHPHKHTNVNVKKFMNFLKIKHI